MKKTILNLGIFLVTLIVALLVCEAIFRYIIPPPYRVRNIEFYNTMYQPDPVLGYTLKPNIQNEYLHTNSYGLRGPEPKPARTNIICVGDSHTFGWAVGDEFTYPQQLQGLLGDKFNVINMGVGGYNISRQVAFLNRYLKEFKPQLVIFGVVVDDILNDLSAGSFIPNSAEDISESHKYKGRRFKSALVTYIKDIIPGMQIKLHLRKPAHEEYYAVWNKKEKFYFYKGTIEDQLMKLKSINAKAIFITFPFPSQVYLGDTKRRPNAELFCSLESDDIKYINLLPIFQANYKRVSTLYLKDGHPNEYAYKLIAQEIFKKIKEGKWLGLSEALE